MMKNVKRSSALHSRDVLLSMLLLLAIGCLGFFLEKQAEASRKVHGATAQGLLSQDDSALGLSGGRARGGSFSRPTAPSGAPGNTIPRTSPGGYDRYPDYGGGYSGGYGGSYYPRQSYPRGGTVIVPAPYPGYIPSQPAPVSVGTDLGFIFLLGVLGFMVLPLIMNLLKLRAVGAPTGVSGSSELMNDVVTVTQVQVALLAQARAIQAELTELATRADLENQVGLSQMLQETVLALLRSPENWSHARLSSETVRSREQATQVFEQRSIAARSKFTRETLVNVGGNVRRQPFTPQDAADPAAYIVLTLIVGTADDRPLFDQQVYSATDLQAVLQRLGAIAPDYLLVYELLWTPQDERDSLSYDEMLAHYPDLIQIA